MWRCAGFSFPGRIKAEEVTPWSKEFDGQQPHGWGSAWGNTLERSLPVRSVATGLVFSGGVAGRGTGMLGGVRIRFRGHSRIPVELVRRKKRCTKMFTDKASDPRFGAYGLMCLSVAPTMVD